MRLRVAGRAALGLALAVLLAACGGSSDGDGDGIASAGGTKTGTKSEKKTDPQQAGLDFARCMREHGIDMPDPQADGRGLVMIGPADSASVTPGAAPPDGFREADEACRHHLEGLIGDGPGPIDPKEQDRALAFARCMREHGVNMPDPDFTGGGVRIQIGGEGGIDPQSQTFQDAQKACGSLFGPGEGASPGLAVRGGGRSS